MVSSYQNISYSTNCFKKSRIPLAKRPIKIACEKVYHQKNYLM